MARRQRSHEGRALYFSRAPIPYPQQTEGRGPLRHIGIYAYQLPALFKLADLEPSPLEIAESLEQLRALDNGITLRVLEIERAWLGVDTMEDLERVEEILFERASGST